MGIKKIARIFGKKALEVILSPINLSEELYKIKLKEHGACPLYHSTCDGFEPSIFSINMHCNTYKGVLNPACSRYVESMEVKNAIQIS